MASTAFAAREMRFRIQSFLETAGNHRGKDDGPRVSVYQGRITSEARKAGGIDSMIHLRPDARSKRFDRRHHAVDAAVLTMLRPGIAKTLKERADIHRDNRDTGDRPDWLEYRGAHPGDRELFDAWLIQMRALSDLIVAERDADRIAVVRPLRLSPRIGALHADTVEPLETKMIADAFTAEEIRRVCDTRLFTALAEAATGGDLDSDRERGTRVAWNDMRPVHLFPSNAPFLAVRGGAVKIGSSARTARVYAWRSGDGFRFAWIRVFAGEFGKLGLLQPGVDVLTAELPLHSQTMRCADPALVRRILKGDARMIGWLTLGDEIEINPEPFLAKESKLAHFLRNLPERRWVLTGMMSNFQMSIAPSYLALEGVTDETSDVVKQVLVNNRIAMAVNVILDSPDCNIIRRTVLGRPRWSPDGLPASWSPSDAAARAFDA
jgi:CRISPR-associated endonuclease Csn1